jgi:hypothetical protein
VPISEKERNRIELSIFFSFSEIEVLNSPELLGHPRPANFKKEDIIGARLAASNQKIAEAHTIKTIIDKSYHGEQKIGEPDWNEVQHEAERALGKKLLEGT